MRARSRARRWLVWTLTPVLIAVLTLWGGWTVSNSRTFQFYGGLTDRVDTAAKVVALTLDDGPTDATPEVLRTLATAGVRATFFVTGQELAAHPEHGRAIVRAGHELGNHSYSHQRMVLVGSEFVRTEIERTDERIRAAGHTGEIHFRPPNGKKLFTLPAYLAERQRQTITWDVEPESDGTDAADPAAITRSVLEKARPGSIVLLHVMYPVRRPSLEAVPAVVAGLKERGYRFVTISELLALRR